MTAHSHIPTSDVDASQDQRTDTSIGQDPTPAAQNRNHLTIQRDSLNVLGLSLLIWPIYKKKNKKKNDDTFIRDIYLYFHNGTLPDLQKEAQKILLQNSDFLFIDNVLFHSRVAKAIRIKDMNQFQLVLPQCKIMDVLHLYDDSPLGGHCGIQDCLDRVKEHYYFSRMAEVSADYVRACVPCQQQKLTQNHTKSAIDAYLTPCKPFRFWQVDSYQPLPFTVSGYTYILTAVDMFSKFLFTVPLAADDACTVSEGLNLLFTTFGSCDTLISDRGTEFTAKVTQILCHLFQIKQEFTPSFVHHCLGACGAHSCYHSCQAYPVSEFQTKQLG